jgi:hypothetical protein
VNGSRISAVISKHRAYGSIRQTLLLLSQVLDLHNDHVTAVTTAAIKKTAGGRIGLHRANHLKKAVTQCEESII